FDALTVSHEVSEIALGIVMVTGHFVLMFLCNFGGQSLIDHSAEIFNSAYNTMWYLAPLSIQKLLLFVMQNSIRTQIVKIGYVYVLSLEGFSTVINTLY
ncbi:hypothetical protein ALC57_15071, partial [Trachymyrmex cornetzi]